MRPNGVEVRVNSDELDERQHESVIEELVCLNESDCVHLLTHLFVLAHLALDRLLVWFLQALYAVCPQIVDKCAEDPSRSKSLFAAFAATSAASDQFRLKSSFADELFF